MKQRIISAVIAGIIVLPLIILGGLYFKVLILILGIFSLYELMKARSSIPQYIKYIVYLLFVLFFINNFTLIDISFYMDMRLLILAILTLTLPLIIYHDNKLYNIDDAFYLIGSLFFISLAFNIISLVRDEGIMVFVYILLITTTTDIFAYILGTKFGKHKLVPSISPKKSIEGFIYGAVIGTIIASGFYLLFISSSNYMIIVFTLLLSVVGQFGDLIFSSIKRHYDIKDFSNIMPGHGGILDRIDSLIFVAMVYIYIIELL